MPERIDLLQADDPRDVVHRAVACLAKGGLVGLATDSGYGLIASALNLEAVGRLKVEMDGLADSEATTLQNDQGPSLLLRSAEELADWANLGSTSAWRLSGRLWPGPVTLRVVPSSPGLVDRLSPQAREFLINDGRFSVRVPSDRMVREMIRLTSGPLIQVDGASLATAVERQSTLCADDLASIAGLEMILDSGERPIGPLPTVVAIDGSGWSVIRPGVISERNIAERAATIILFVCTGNTCRSPMAEALCKAILSRRLGCSIEDLVDRGYLVISAGVAASGGMPAADHAIQVVGTRGGSLVEHLSRPATPQLVQQADHILAMTWDHLDALIDQVPEVSNRVRLLDPAGDDIADPVGLDQEIYQETAREIERHLESFLRDLGILA